MTLRSTIGFLSASATTLAVLSVVICGVAVAQQPPNAAWAGAGATSCAKFGEFYAHVPESTEDIYYSWALGFMSGLNAMVMADKQQSTNLSLWDGERQKQELRQFCSDNPLKDYVQAVYALYFSMRAEGGLPKVHIP